MDFPKATKNYQYNDKTLGQNVNQISGTGLCQNTPRYSLLIVVVIDKFAWINTNVSITHLAFTFNYSVLNLENNFETL